MPAPDTISGLAVWFHASDLSGLADGTAVGESGVTPWTSRAGTSVGTAITARQPTKQTVSGKHVVRFATDDRISCNGTALSFSNNVAGATILIRAAISSASSDAIVFVSNGVSDASSRCTMYTSAGGALQSIGRRLDADGAVILTGGALSGSPQNLVVKADYTNTTLTNYVNGSQTAQDTTTLTAGNTSATNGLYFGIGGENSAGADLTSADIYELVVYNKALSGGEQATVEAWLTNNSSESFVFVVRQNMPLR